MEHLMKLNPSHVRLVTGVEVPDLTMRPVEAYHFGLELPHILQVRTNTRWLILPSEHPLACGDTVTDEYNGNFMVAEILERRKARGDWRLNPYDQAPDFVKVFVL